MQPAIQDAVQRGLSDRLQACIATGNTDAAVSVLFDADAALMRRQITQQHFWDLERDYQFGFNTIQKF